MRLIYQLVASLSPLAMALAAVAADHTVAHYRFEEGAVDAAASGDGSILDSSVNQFAGTPVLSPVYRADTSPVNGGANTRSMEFDGITGQRIVVPDNPAFALTHSLTLEALIMARPMLPGTGGGGDIVVRNDARPGLDPYRLTLLQPGNILAFGIVDEAQDSASIQTLIPYDQWLHVAGTLDDATGQMKLYVNGVVADSTTTSIRPLADLDPFSEPAVSIGEDSTGIYGEAFNGLLDEVRISDAALLPSEFVPEPATPLVLASVSFLAVMRSRRSR